MSYRSMNRRDVLKRLLWAGAVGFVPGILSCTAGHHSATTRPKKPIRIDDSFARLALRSIDHAPPNLRSKMLRHPALTALFRHQRLAGNRGGTLDALLDSVLESVWQSHPTSGVLDAWSGREAELGEFVEAAALYLPGHVAFGGIVYLVMGYDIGVAAPPDLCLNVGHEHFLNDPRELGFYATHEAHHVGFMTLRQPPALAELNEPKRLLEIIRYMTQLEGMGVHAVFDLRAEHSALSADADYRIYTDLAERQRVKARYAELVSKLSGADAISDDNVGTIMNGMSSGERVWYRFGALVSWTLERSRGRNALIQSIADPAIFWAVAKDLLRA